MIRRPVYGRPIGSPGIMFLAVSDTAVNITALQRSSPVGRAVLRRRVTLWIKDI